MLSFVRSFVFQFKIVGQHHPSYGQWAGKIYSGWGVLSFFRRLFLCLITPYFRVPSDWGFFFYFPFLCRCGRRRPFLGTRSCRRRRVFVFYWWWWWKFLAVGILGLVFLPSNRQPRRVPAPTSSTRRRFHSTAAKKAAANTRFFLFFDSLLFPF